MTGPAVAAALFALTSGAGEGGTPPFDAVTLETAGRITQRHTADLDGDGLEDILLLLGRTARVHFQDPSLGFRAEADLSLEIARDAILFDTGDVDGDPKTRELVLLGTDSVSAVSFRGRKAAPLGKPLAPAPKSRLRPDAGDVHWRPLARDLGGTPGDELILPAERAFAILARETTTGAYGDTGRVPLMTTGSVDPGSDALLSRFRASVGYPALHVADLDGDGAPDLAAATLDEIVFFRGSKGGPLVLPGEWKRFPTGLERRRDRPSPAEPVVLDDADGDGRADLLVVDGPAGTIRVFTSGADGPEPEESPAQVLRIDGWILETSLLDLDGDGRRDLCVASTPEIGILEGARIVLEKSLAFRIDAFPARREAGGKEPFARTPSASVQRFVPVAFATGGPARFEMTSAPRPSVLGDFDGDGRPDLFAPIDAGSLGVFRGSAPLRFEEKPSLSIPLPPGDAASRGSEAWLRDLNADGRTDIVLLHKSWDRASDRLDVVLSRPAGRAPRRPERE